MAERRYLPIKVVLPTNTDFEDPDPGGSTKIFGEVTHGLRKRLADEAADVRKRFQPQLQRNPAVPCIAKVRLKKEAMAKSHRPTRLFTDDTCPICAVKTPVELYVAVTDAGLREVEARILSDNTEKGLAAISTIISINPWTEEDSLGNRTAADIAEEVKHSKGKRLRIQLFTHRNQRQNAAILQLLETAAGVPVETFDYGDGDLYAAVPAVPAQKVRLLASLPATRSLGAFPDYRIVRTSSHSLGPLSIGRFPPPIPGVPYGVVGIIDSGTDPDSQLLKAWVRDRWDAVPRTQQNNSHGTFVAGLIVHSRKLNGGDRSFPDSACRIVDVVAFDETGEVSEYDLMNIIDEAICRFPDVRVWNLSLGLVGPCCRLDEFSPFGRFLDSRSKQHEVLFVVAAGNWPHPHQAGPLRTFPPQAIIGDGDRICPPADALRGLTVGSIAHKHNESACVKAEQPSPFSRRGPAGGYLLKPDLSHNGGNCDANGDYVQTGVVSLEVGQRIAENIGTSFATPIVSSIAGSLYHELDVPTGDASPLLVKGMMIHSSLVKTNPTKVMVNYTGVGRPLDVEEMVNCSASEALMVLRVPMSSKKMFFKHSFPMPPSLRTEDGKVFARIYMTVVHDCPMDGGYGLEYCRSNLLATLGTVNSAGEDYKRHVKPIAKPASAGSEAKLVMDGFKWSPVKLYVGDISDVDANRSWRLKLWLQHRNGYLPEGRQEALIFITIIDPRGQGKVYDELVRGMNQLAWRTHDLQIRSRVGRVR
jgi:hypothetical protein